MLGLLLVGCGSRPPYDSNATRDFVRVDTSRSVGTPLVPVYSRTLLQSDWPQHFVPLERPDSEHASDVREHLVFRMKRPILEWGDVPADIYAFTSCVLQESEPCAPERAVLFFSVQGEITSSGRQFGQEFARQLRIVIDEGTVLFDGQPAYETHGITGTILEEMWVALSYEDFQKLIASEEVNFRFRRETMRLSGRKLKPFRALVAAAEGRSSLDENP